MRDDAVPVVSLHRSGDGSVTFGTGRGAGSMHLEFGALGLGAAPVSFSSSPRLAGHGSTLRGKHLGERDIMLPLVLEGPSMSAVNTTREDLLRFLSPLDDRELTLRVSVPGRTRYREIPVHYAGGLEGDYAGDYHGTWERRGLEFKATEALWRGEPVQIGKSVDPGTKPFLSATENFFPVLLSDSTVAGKLVVDVQGEAPTYPVWTITPPGEDLLIRKGSDEFYLEGLLTETINLDMATGRLWSASDPSGDLLYQRVPATRSRLFSLTPGRNEVEFAFVGATEASQVFVTYQPRYLAGY